MLEEDGEDEVGIGHVGDMSDQLETEALFWRLVCNLRLSPSEIDRWTLSEMRLAEAYMKMQNDYKRVYPAFKKYEEKQKKEQGLEDGNFGNL